jgi:excisionase family DNA binding protein
LKDLLSREQTAEFLGVPSRTLANWAYLRTGPRFYKVGKHTRYRLADVLDWLEQNAREPRVSS